MGGIKFFQEFFAGLTTSVALLGSCMNVHYKKSQLWDHLGPPQPKENQQILSNSRLIMGIYYGRGKIFL